MSQRIYKKCHKKTNCNGILESRTLICIQLVSVARSQICKLVMQYEEYTINWVVRYITCCYYINQEQNKSSLIVVCPHAVREPTRRPVWIFAIKMLGDPCCKQMRNCCVQKPLTVSCVQRLEQVGKNSGRVYVCEQMCACVLFNKVCRVKYIII